MASVGRAETTSLITLELKEVGSLSGQPLASAPDIGVFLLGIVEFEAR